MTQRWKKISARQSAALAAASDPDAPSVVRRESRGEGAETVIDSDGAMRGTLFPGRTIDCLVRDGYLSPTEYWGQYRITPSGRAALTLRREWRTELAARRGAGGKEKKEGTK